MFLGSTSNLVLRRLCCSNEIVLKASADICLIFSATSISQRWCGAEGASLPCGLVAVGTDQAKGVPRFGSGSYFRRPEGNVLHPHAICLCGMSVRVG